MRLVEDVQSTVPMNCKQVTVRLFHVEQESLFLRIANMFSHKGRCQQFGGHWERVLLSERVFIQKLFGVTLPGQRSHIAGMLTRNTGGEYQIPAHQSPFFLCLFVSSTTDQERNTVVRFAVSQHECCLSAAR